MKTAIELIAEERQRQIEVEGWTIDHDDEHSHSELAQAAAVYATPEFQRNGVTGTPVALPWNPCYWKPTPDNRIRELVKAGALIVAEIERLQRAANDAAERV